MKNIDHTVLALKYRPKTFKELIGQDVMVQTITNSIKFNNTASHNNSKIKILV